jgi:LmbE family N-acetylglucosaminyl deacetylase
MKFLNFNKVLCLSPHPDDTEFSMMGTILKYYDTHFDILVLSKGGFNDLTNKEDRFKEVLDVWGDTQNVSVFSPHGSNFIQDKTEGTWVDYIEKNFLKKYHDAIFIPSAKDAHWEHQIVARLGTPLIRSSYKSVIEYKTASTLDTWNPDLFVNIEKQYDSKVNSLNKFKSQSDSRYFHHEVIRQFHVNFQCVKKQYFLVEQFKFISHFC